MAIGRSRPQPVQANGWQNAAARCPVSPTNQPIAFVLSLSLALCLLVGAFAMEDETLSILAAGLAALLFLLYSPAILIMGFGAIAFASGWFYVAGQEGIFSVPPYVTQVWAWALILGAVTLVKRGPLRAPDRIVAGLGIYVAVLVYSIILGGFRTGSMTLLLDGGKSVVIMLSPFIIAAQLSRTRSLRLGIFIVAGIVLSECIFAVVQYIGIHGNITGYSLFTVGSLEGWWNTNAVFGTFPTLGKNNFGGALALCAPLLLAWALSQERLRIRLILLSVYVITVVDVVLSLSRGAMLAVLISTIVVGTARVHKRFLVLFLLLAAGLYLLPVTNSTFSALERQGIKDQDAQVRLTIWQAATEHISALSWIGDGYGTGVNASANLHVDLINVSSQGATTVPTENMYLRQFLEGGVLAEAGLLLFLGLLIRETFARSNTPAGQVWRVGLRGTIVALIVYSMFGDALRYGQMEGVLCLAVGVVTGALILDRAAVTGAGSRRKGVPAG